MVDIGARSSTWGYELGLQSIIPSVLTLGLLGYPFIMVGPVGGVPANDFNSHLNQFAHPDEELYIRWVSFCFGCLQVMGMGLDEISVGKKLFWKKQQQEHIKTNKSGGMQWSV